MSNGSRFTATFVLCGLLCCQVSPAEGDTPKNSLTTTVYQVEDILQAASPDTNSRLPLAELTQLIQENVAPDSWKAGERGASIVPYAETHSLVVRQTQENHQAIADLLESLRHLCDVQVSLELRFVQMPDAFTAQWTESRVLSNDEWQKTLDAIKTEPQAILLHAPKITLMNGHRGTVSLPNSPQTPSVHLTGVASTDRRSVKTKVYLDYPAQPSANTLTEYSIPDSQTAFVGTIEDLPSRLFDPAYLAENGIDVVQRSVKKTMVFLTVRLIFKEEVEELLNQKVSRSLPISSWISTCGCRYEYFCPMNPIAKDDLKEYPNKFAESWEDLKKARPKKSSQVQMEQPPEN